MWVSILLFPLAQDASPTIGTLQEIAKAGPTVILLAVGWLLLTGRLVAGKTHDRVVQERDQLLRLALANAQVAKSSLGKLEEAAQEV